MGHLEGDTHTDTKSDESDERTTQNKYSNSKGLIAQMVIIRLGHSVHNFHREFSDVTEGGGGFVGFGGVVVLASLNIGLRVALESFPVLAPPSLRKTLDLLPQGGVQASEEGAVLIHIERRQSGRFKHLIRRRFQLNPQTN